MKLLQVAISLLSLSGILILLFASLAVFVEYKPYYPILTIYLSSFAGFSFLLSWVACLREFGKWLE